MIDLLAAFTDELRAAGVPVSMVEAIDAAQAVRHIDLADREQLRNGLAATMVKNARHLTAFDIVFDVFFGLQSPSVESEESAARTASDIAAITGGSGVGEGDSDSLIEALIRALQSGDDQLMHAIIRQAVSRYAGMEPGRPVGGTYYLYRVLRQLDVQAVEQRLVEGIEGDLSPLEARLLREEVADRLERFRELLRDEIRRRLVADRGPEAVARTLRRPLIEDVDLTAATREELADIDRVIHPLTRKLAIRLAQRRRAGRQGRLDVRKTMRAALSTGGVPIDPKWRKPHPSKPELVLLCDISGSMSTFARFTMQVVNAMSGQFSRVRSFAFIDAIDEVTDFFGAGAEFGDAMARIGREAKVVWLDGHSDYGHAFAQFATDWVRVVTPRSTVIVTGDARTNYHDPDVAAFRAAVEEARAVFWLNPERRRYWDTGDSVMSAYAPVCDAVYEVRNLRQLEHFVGEVALPRSQVRPVIA